MSKKKAIFFVGTDITAHLILNGVVRKIMAEGTYEPVLYFPKNAYSKRADIEELRYFSFFDKTLLNEVVYPFIDDKPCLSAGNLSPQQLAEKYSLHVEIIEDVNDSLFINKLTENKDIGCAISIRCTQLFGSEIVDAIKKTAPFLNLHSGLLPEYRGVMPTIRRMFDIATGSADTSEYGCTLHKVEPFDPNALHKGIDTGKIIEVKSIQLNPTHSGYLANVGLVAAGIDALTNVLSQISGNYTLRGYPQNNDASAYYTFPTSEELKNWENAGIVLVRPDEAINTLVSSFSKANSPHGTALTLALQSAIHQKYGQALTCQSGCACYVQRDVYKANPNAQPSLSSMGAGLTLWPRPRVA